MRDPEILDDYIARLVAEAPEFTSKQVDRLTLLLLRPAAPVEHRQAA